MKTDLKKTAVDYANWIYANMFPPHRGVTIACALPRQEFVIAFGNDGYMTDPRTKRYADALVSRLRSKYGSAELGVGTSEDRYTWAIVVPVDDSLSARVMIEPIEAMLYQEYCRARSLDENDPFVWRRAEICRREVDEHLPEGCILVDG